MSEHASIMIPSSCGIDCVTAHRAYHKGDDHWAFIAPRQEPHRMCQLPALWPVKEVPLHVLVHAVRQSTERELPEPD